MIVEHVTSTAMEEVLRMPTAMVATAKTVFEELTMLTVSANVPLTGSELPTEPALSVTQLLPMPISAQAVEL